MIGMEKMGIWRPCTEVRMVDLLHVGNGKELQRALKGPHGLCRTNEALKLRKEHHCWMTQLKNQLLFWVIRRTKNYLQR